MTRLLATVFVTGALSVFTAAAQSTSNDTNTTTTADDVIVLENHTPSENVRSASLQARAPGVKVRAAITRTGTDSNDDSSSNGSSGTGTSSGTSSGSTSGLSGLLSGLLGGSSSSTSGLSGVLGSLLSSPGGVNNLTNLLSGFTGGSSASNRTNNGLAVSPNTPQNKSSTSAVLAAQSDQSSSVQDLVQLRDQAAQQRSSSSGAISRLPVVAAKTDSRAQTAQTDDRKFGIRLMDSLLGTFFTALTTGLTQQFVVDFIKDLIRPIFNIPDPNAAPPADTNNNGDDNNGDSQVRSFSVNSGPLFV